MMNNPTVYVILTLLVTLSPIMVFLIAFGFSKRDGIMSKYDGSEESSSLFVKKYDEANVKRYSMAFFWAGMASVILGITMAFNYMPKVEDDGSNLVAVIDEDEVEEVPATNQTPPPPPPPPPPPEVIEVDDEEEIEEEPEIFEQDFDDEEEIEEVVYEEPVVEEEEETVEEIFRVVEQMPEFPGGEKEMYKWLAENIKYPQVARENGIEGKVYVEFVVDKTGKVGDVKILRGPGGGTNEEAERVVKKMPRWKAGKQRGKPVSVRYTIPVFFSLQ
jgi:protein TonB